MQTNDMLRKALTKLLDAQRWNQDSPLYKLAVQEAEEVRANLATADQFPDATPVEVKDATFAAAHYKLPSSDIPALIAFERHRAEQAKIIGMPGLAVIPSFIAGFHAGGAAPSSGESAGTCPDCNSGYPMHDLDCPRVPAPAAHSSAPVGYAEPQHLQELAETARPGAYLRLYAKPFGAHRPTVPVFAAPAPAGESLPVQGVPSDHYRDAIAQACEGFNMPADLRKFLETALWADVAPTGAST